MWIYGPDVEAPVCTHTSSIIGQAPNSNWIELGWVSAKSGTTISDALDPNRPLNKCVESGGDGSAALGHGKPELFRSSSKNGGIDWRCTVFYDIDSADWNGPKSFSVYDTHPGDLQYVWETKYAGNSIGGTKTMNYSTSYSTVNAERYTPDTAAWPTGESADAKFDHLQYFRSDSTWTNWAAVTCTSNNFPGSAGAALDNDPTYKVEDWMSDPTSVHVSTSGTRC